MRLDEVIKTNRFNDENHKASLNILYTAYWLKDHFISVLKPHGITLEQHNVMRILKGSHPKEVRVKDIASRMVEKSSNVPRIIDKLVAKNLAVRINSDIDKRETFVGITDKCISVIDNARVSIDQVTKKISGVTEKEAQTLNKLLEKMRG